MTAHINLRAARRLETTIDSEVKELRDVTAASAPVYNIFDSTPVNEVFAAHQSSFLQKIDTINRLLEVRASIRRQIQEANEKSGINELISQLTLLEELERVVKEIDSETGRQNRLYGYGLRNQTSEFNVTALLNEVNAARKAAESDGKIEKNYSLPLMSTETKMELKERSRGYRSDINKLQDKLLNLNATTAISISNEDIAILKTVGIVV